MARRVLIPLALLACVAGGAVWARLPARPAPPTAAARTYDTEQEWIVASIARAMAAMALRQPDVPVTVHAVDDVSVRVVVAGLPPLVLTAAPHMWAPETYQPLAKALLTARPDAAVASGDLGVRTRLADFSASSILDEDLRVSAALQQQMRSAAAQEAAALVVGTFALRESAGLFNDVRPALSRMTAHLALASQLRNGSPPESFDGTLARIVLTLLSGLQRDALSMTRDAAPRAITDMDRAWLRALTLRITIDWRHASPATDAPGIERIAYAKAVHDARGVDAMLDYLDTTRMDNRADWHRIAFASGFTVEAGDVFTDDDLDQELAEAALARRRLRGDTLTSGALVAALNDASASTPFVQDGDVATVRVLDWGAWAAAAQRHLCSSLLAHASQAILLGHPGSHDELVRDFDRRFGGLRLYPIAVVWMADGRGDYERGIADARALAERTPEALTAGAWDMLLRHDAYGARDTSFPLDVPWFTPAVPAGTAFDLDSRSLRPGCPRPPTQAQAAIYAADRPYDEWAVWSNAYLALDRGAPSLAAVRAAFGPLLEYQRSAVRKLIDYTAMSEPQRIQAARALCDITADDCGIVAELQLRADHTEAAAAAYAHWIQAARDSVAVSNEVTWITRYYLAHGSPDRAEAIATGAADTGSATGLSTLGELREHQGRYDQAESLYRDVQSRYEDSRALGAFMVRQGVRNGDAGERAKGEALLRPYFPDGLQPVVMHALPVRPVDGVVAGTFGARAARIGLRPDDIIVGVDGWRVHGRRQYNVAASLRDGDRMTLTVWRGERFQELALQVPERTFGVRWRDYRAR